MGFMESLLDRARAVETKTLPNAELAQLAVAWAHDDVTLLQASEAMGKSGNGMYATLSRGLRDAVRLGLLARAALPKKAGKQ